MTAAVTQLQAEPDAMEEPVDDVCGNHETGWCINAGRVSVYQRVSGWMSAEETQR